MIERVAHSQKQREDNLLTLRPQTLADFIGQESLKANMHVFITAAKKRGDPIDHILISGPPGLGKTTFSQIIAREMGANLRATSAPAIERGGDLASLLSSLQSHEVLFIDEIHRLRPAIEEVLYPALEDFHLDLSLGVKGNSKSVRITLPPFTLIGATTKPGSLTQPLISRFGITNRFQLYTHTELTAIAKRNIALLNLTMTTDGISELSKRCRGTPRILNRLIRRIRDFAQVQNQATISSTLIDYALKQLSIDALGLDDMDRRLLTTLIRHFDGGPVGIENLATSLSEDPATLEDIYEPYLIQLGFLKRTRQGRMATPHAFSYIGVKNIPAALQNQQTPGLFESRQAPSQLK